MPDDTYIVQDITKLTKVIGCSEEYYESQNEDTDAYYESTLYLVNNGVNIEDTELGTKAYSDAYYGRRKISDIEIVREYPGDENYPNNKFYVEAKVSIGGVVTGYQLYFKYNDCVVEIGTSAYVTGVMINDNKRTVTVDWYTTDGTEESTTLLIVDEDGNLPDDIIEQLKQYLLNELKDELELKWQAISSLPEYKG